MKRNFAIVGAAVGAVAIGLYLQAALKRQRLSRIFNAIPVEIYANLLVALAIVLEAKAREEAKTLEMQPQ